MMDTDIFEDNGELSSLDEISVRFIRAVKVLRGNNDALRLLESIKTVLGNEWAARVIFNQLSNNFSNIENITLVGFDSLQGKNINAIKELRTISGLGLKESKDAIEGAEEGKNFLVTIIRTINPKQVADSVKALRSFGVKVVIS